MQGKKLGEEALSRVYDINPKFTLTMIVGARPSLRREVIEFSSAMWPHVAKIGPKSSPRGHVSLFLSLYAAPVTGRPVSLNWYLKLERIAQPR